QSKSLTRSSGAKVGVRPDRSEIPGVRGDGGVGPPMMIDETMAMSVEVADPFVRSEGRGPPRPERDPGGAGGRRSRPPDDDRRLGSRAVSSLGEGQLSREPLDKAWGPLKGWLG